LRTLLSERAALEKQLADLRARKSQLPAAEYDALLEALLLRIARLGQAIRAEEARQ
jgi:hypothetical protein